MPTELRNIKGGGLHYVAYKSIHLVTLSRLKPSSSELGWNTTEHKRKDSSKIQEGHQHQITMTQLTTKE